MTIYDLKKQEEYRPSTSIALYRVVFLLYTFFSTVLVRNDETYYQLTF